MAKAPGTIRKRGNGWQVILRVNGDRYQFGPRSEPFLGLGPSRNEVKEWVWFTLTDQTVVAIVADTEIEDGESDEHLGSLEEVQAALDAFQIVEAEGEGSIDSEDPLVLTAIEVEFEIENDGD